jgi:hypothetical protein
MVIMRTLIIGDMHTNTDILRKSKDVDSIDRVILLGDYMDDWHASSSQRIRMAQCLHDYIHDMGKRGIQVDALLGNHDIAYLLGREDAAFNTVLYKSPGFDEEAHDEVHSIYQHIPFSIMSSVNVRGEQWLCSHAGITDSWMRYALTEHDDAIGVMDEVNAMNDWYTLFMCDYSRGGHDRYASPLWADKSELIDDHAKGFNQIVGHTPVKCITMMTDDDSRLLFADTFSTLPSGEHIGDCSAFVMDDACDDSRFGLGINITQIFA